MPSRTRRCLRFPLLIQELQRATEGTGLAVAELAQAALGGQLLAMALELESVKQAEEIQPHKSFERGVVKGASGAVKRLLDGRRMELRKLDGMIEAAFSGRIKTLNSTIRPSSFQHRVVSCVAGNKASRPQRRSRKNRTISALASGPRGSV